MSLKELEKDITCAICQEYYTDPKILPCFHYYCKQCILDMVHSSSNKAVSCPQCRKEANILERDVESLKPAFFVHHLKQAHSTATQLEGSMTVKCEACESRDPVKSFCRQCALFLCKSCVHSHQKMKKMFKDHMVISIGKEGIESTTELKDSTPECCSVHGDALSLYCYKCMQHICLRCTLEGHNNHNFGSTCEASQKIKEELTQMYEVLKNEKEILQEIVKKSMEVRRKIEIQNIDVTMSVHASFRQLFEILSQSKQAILNDVKKEFQSRILSVEEQVKALCKACGSLEDNMDKTEESIVTFEDHKIASYSNLITQIHNVLEDCSRVKNMEPAIEADIGVEVNCAESLQQLCLTHAKVIRLPIDPTQCTVAGAGIRTALIHEETEAFLTANTLVNNAPTRRSASVVSSLKYLYNESVKVECIVSSLTPGKYHIKYTPTARGRHKLTVSVDKQEIVGSPFSVFVSIPSTKLGKTVRVWDDLNSVSGIAINSQQEVILVNQSDSIITFYKNNQMLRNINLSYHLLMETELVNVCVDQEDSIFVIMLRHHGIIKLDKYGNLINIVYFNPNIPCLGMVLVENEVLTSTAGHDCAIVVHDRNLNYIRTVNFPSMGSFHGIAADTHNIYVSDRGEKCIRVFNHNLDFIRSFGCSRRGAAILTRPLGLCVFCEHLYVCNNGLDSNNHHVAVFTIQGDHVATFGQRGSKKGSFRVPRAITVDADGFIYVCDKENERVQIF